MTRINKLVMHGFKSFARPTELAFGNTFNCVLGPNGSGKSNILDALCFVLGRISAKSMRAEKSANLVYNGGKTRKPMKQGEVSIFFDNSKKTFPTEDPEVKITRVIKKNGQSVYKINDKKMTRQQVLDLMSVAKIDPDGYNIILQGDIVRFIEMKPEERRLLIEEISGISVYEEKKLKALRELEKVEERLKEADIILTERETYLKELKKERDQAIKFKDLQSKVKTNKASYLHIQIEKKNKEKEKLQTKINDLKEKLDKANSNVNEIKKIIQEKKETIGNISQEIEQKGEKEQVLMHREVEDLKVKLAKKQTRLDHCKGELERIDQRKGQLEKDLVELDVQIENLNKGKEEIDEQKSSLNKEVSKIESQIVKFREDNQLDSIAELDKQVEEFDAKAEEKQKEINDMREKQQGLLRKKDYIEFQVQGIDEKIKKVLEIEKEHADQIEELKKNREEFKSSVVELNKRLNEDSEFAKRLADLHDKLVKNQEEMTKLEARNLSIRESVAGSLAVKKILEQKKQGVYGTVAELGTANSKYSLALEIAAGPRIKSIVVESDKIAADCIKHLKKNRLGVATFLPMNKIKAKNINDEAKKLIKADGCHGLAIDLIDFDPKFRKIFSYVFGDVLVVDNIDVARRLGIGAAKMVTLEGDFCDVSGAMQGGFRDRKKGESMGFQEKEVSKNLEALGSEIEELRNSISSLEGRRKANENKIDELRQRKATLEGEIIKSEKSLHLESGDVEATKNSKQELKEQAKEIEKEITEVMGKISSINKELANNKIKKQDLRNKINELRNPTLMAELNAFEEKRKELREKELGLNNDIKTNDSRINEIILPEKEKIQGILKQQDKEYSEFTNEINALNESIKLLNTGLEEKEKRSKEFYAKYKALFTERTKVSDTIQQDENKVEKLRNDSKDVEIEMNKYSLDNARVSAELAGLNQEFSQYEGVLLDTSKSEEQFKSEINKFERMVSDFGNVNMRALEIYEEVEKEYNTLHEKKEKLHSEKDDVLVMMGEIEGKKKELFMRTFDAVNDNFKRIFSTLSKKGDASLELEDPEHIFEAGLNIKVRITGQKFLDIRSLSGGEKTMTALAFIFSIQEYAPHSFYILDEVDAALDKHNSEKLSKLIRQYSDKAQYVVISHNDAIISEADILYGISMDEHGTSKCTSLKI